MAEDAVTLITRDHRELEHLFDRLRIDVGARPLLMRELAAMLIAHSRAEEEKVYPEIAKASPEEKGEVHHGAEEHHKAEQILHRLERVSPDSSEFESVLGELVDAVTHHVQEEETAILPALKEAVGPDRLVQMGKAFEDRRGRELRNAMSAAGTGTGSSDDASKTELYEEARKEGVEGRSTMSKDDLAKAVRRQS